MYRLYDATRSEYAHEEGEEYTREQALAYLQRNRHSYLIQDENVYFTPLPSPGEMYYTGGFDDNILTIADID